MKLLSELTLAEKIVWLFLEKVTEAHRGAVEKTLGIDEEQFSRAIPDARDLGIRTLRNSVGVGINPRTGGPAFGPDGKTIGPIFLTPIYDRKGWWTARPTKFLVARAMEEGRKRNRGELEREARMYGIRFGPQIGHAANYSAGSVNAQLTVIQSLPGIKALPERDPVVRDIDLAVAKNSKRLFVSR